MATRQLSAAIRSAAKREGLGIEAYRRKYGFSQAHFYKLVQGRPPIPERTAKPLRLLCAAGVKHPLLRLV